MRTHLQQLPDHARKVFSGVLFDVYQWDQEMYDGSTAVFEKVRRADSAGVLAVTPDKKIVVTYQEQPSIAPFWSLIGGIVDDGETARVAAERELLEEAGLHGELMDWFQVKPATKIEWTIYGYIAHNCTKVAEQHLDAGEKITLHELSFDAFIACTQRDDFRDTEVAIEVLRALAFPEKMKELRRLILGE